MAKKLSLPDHIRRWREKPSDMVRDLFHIEPDAWQADVLDAFPKTPRIALLASKGVGKTFLLAVLVWNFLLTRKHPKIACISISGANLSDNLWSELALLRSKAPLLQELFEYTSKKIFSKQQGMENVWFCSARSWAATADRAQQASALAGLHADQIMFIIDESGSMPESILASAENALASCVEGHIIQAGNPEKLEGPLYRAYKSNAENGGDWMVVPINGDPDNPKRSPRVSIEWARAQIKEWGRANNFVKVNVFGEFPSASLNALIGPEEVEEAMKRYWRPFDIGRAAKILGIDVARQGDDSSVIAKRQGIQMLPFIKRRGLNSNEGAALVAREWDAWGANAAFIDATGGFGFGWIDQLNNLGKSPVGVQFAGSAHNKNRFLNKRAEMAWDLVEWIKAGGGLPECPELAAALIKTTYDHKNDLLYLEPKEMVKAKLGYSPDEFDAAILCFAEPISIGANSTRSPNRSAVDQNFDIFNPQQPGAGGGYDPFPAYNPIR